MNFSKFFLIISALVVSVLAVMTMISAMPVRDPLVASRKLIKNNNNKHVKHSVAIANRAAAAAALRNDTFTISGISAGAAMSIQYGIAFSSTVQANGIIAGIPYTCSQGMMGYALACMDAPEIINIQNIISTAQEYASFGLIDPMDNIKNHYLHLWSGKSDTVVVQGVMMLVAEMYQYMGVTSMESIFNYSSEHAWITNNYGNDCDYLGEPYVNNCGYDFSGEFLSRSWKHMRHARGISNLGPWNSQKGVMNTSRFFAFDQTKYGASAPANSMASKGYVYVPSQCGSVSTSGSNTVLSNPSVRCHLHLNFHGCTQQADLIGLDYISQTNLNEWAEANNIVILYPQSSTNLDNPKACFAWWDFNGFDSNYANKEGAQMKMINEMVVNLQTNGQV